LAQYRIETVTIIAVVIIGIILTIYLAALKRSGWLGRSNRFYRCPNPECRRIFHKPAEVNDLSATLMRVYTACPECGEDLGQYFVQETTPKTKDTSICEYYFGFLNNRDKQEAIPETCLVCHRSVDCMLHDNKLKDSFSALIERIPYRTY
jgi:hypothetical protein